MSAAAQKLSVDPASVQQQAQNLQAAIWEELQKVQQEYTRKIQEATAAGNTAEVMRLVTEMNTKIVEVQTRALEAAQAMTQQLTTPSQPVKRTVYDPKICNIDLDLITYDNDPELFFSLQDDEHFAGIAKAVIEQNPPTGARKHLLKNALKLSPTLAPKVFEVVERCRAAIGLNAEMEIYVNPSTDFNAACYPPHNGKFLLSFTSGLLEKFDQDELAFVMGHELGHALFRHYLMPVNVLMHCAGGEFAPLQIMRMYAWKRAAEISADRVGLICSRNFEAAGRAFFKISSGVTDNSFHAHIKEYINQLSDLQSEMAGQEVSPEDWYSTHPFSPLRLKALDVFHRSETYQNIAGDLAKAELSEEQLEFEIKKLLSLMEPSYISDSSKISRAMTEFLFYAGFVVAAANGTVEESETKALASLLPPEIMQQKMAEVAVEKLPEIIANMSKLAADINVGVPIAGKLNVIKDLTLVAGADGNVDDTEKAALYQACDMLNIRPEFVDHVLASADTEGM